MSRAFIALGSNLDDPAGQVRSGLRALGGIEGATLERASSLYRSAPWGLVDQPGFVNAVACLQTTLTPHALLEGLQAIEAEHGRRRDGPRWGPRTLDLDLLLYDRLCIEDDTLELPHPRMAERAFVLLPLAELAPDLDIPGTGLIAAQLARLDCSGCRKLPAQVD